MKYFRILPALVMALSFYSEGESQTIRVFRTEGVGFQPPSIIILKDFGDENKTFLSDMYRGKWFRKADTLFLNYECFITENELMPKATILPGGLEQQFLCRNDSLFDCTAYPEKEPLATGSDTAFVDLDFNGFFNYHEIKYKRKPLICFKRKIPYPMVSLFYPTQGNGFLLLMGFSGFFEHYFPELNESLIGTWQSQNDTLTLYPLYVQYFNKNGEIEDVRESWNGVGVRFITKGYVLKLTDDSIRQHIGYPFHKEYGRRKQKGFPPRKWEFERYY